MNWLRDYMPFTKSKAATERDDEVRRLRGELAQAVVKNDRKSAEFRSIMAGALRLRKDYDR